MAAQSRLGTQAAALSVVIVLAAMPSSTTGSPGGTILVAFRYDDFSAVSPTGLEREIIEIFRSHGASFTAGVIPYRCAGDMRDPRPQGVVPLTPEKAELLRAALSTGTVEVAQHGYSHQTNEPCCAEFVGVAFDEQLRGIVEGKRLLEELTGSRVDTFAPPWDRYDMSTIRVLEASGFATLSADIWGEADASTRLRFLPATHELANVEEGVAASRGAPARISALVVHLHAYNFVEHSPARGTISLPAFAGLIDRLASQPDVRLVTVRHAAESTPDPSATRYLSSYVDLGRLNRAAWMLPRFLRPRPHVAFYSASGMLPTVYRRLTLYYTLLAAAGLLFGAALMQVAPFRRYVLVARITTLLGCLSSVALLAFVPGFSHGGAAPFALLLGACIGTWLPRVWSCLAMTLRTARGRG